MKTLPDVRAIDLPPVFYTQHRRSALHLLFTRKLEVPMHATVAADQLLNGLFGKAVTFGQLTLLSYEDWQKECANALVNASAIALREFVKLLGVICPTTPVCDSCGQFVIDFIGGMPMGLLAGASCPFCLSGHAQIYPMILRTVSWATGELVLPNKEYDYPAKVGVKIPLTDDAIERWADCDLELLIVLRKQNVSIHGLLAYMHLHEHAFLKLEDASKFLASVSVRSDIRLEQLILEAARFMDDREITNLPHKTFLTDGRRRSEFTPITIGGVPYLLDRQIGTGDKSDVFLARTDNETPERVILKRLRESADADLHDREIKMLTRLAKSVVRGSVYFSQYVPQIVTSESGASEKPVIAFRERGNFVYTLRDVMNDYPEGVDFKTAIWIWKRVLMILDWVHANRIAHAAILPEHILLDAFNHNARLLDWGYAESFGGSLKALSADNRDYYPEEVLSGSPLDSRVDIAMMTRCVIAMLGGNPAGKTLPSSVPDAFRKWMLDEAGYESLQTVCTDSFALHERVSATAKQVYGPPTFHELIMPR